MFVFVRLMLIICLITLIFFEIPINLTPYINNKKVEEARRRSAVDPTMFLGKSSFSGLLTVDPKYNCNLFFWYFPTEAQVSNKTPWILWLQGGPGASRLAGLFGEIGPFQYDPDTKKLQERRYAWTNKYSVLFIDNPVGAGFSFTDSNKGFARDIETCTTHLMTALQQFPLMFQELTHAPLYIAGESYAGVYIPNLAKRIHQQHPRAKLVDVNFKGIILASPVMDRLSVSDYSNTFYKWGLLDTQGYLAMAPYQRRYFNAIKRNDPIAAYELRQVLLNKIKHLTQINQMYNIGRSNAYKELKGFTRFLKRKDVKEALHVGDIKFTFTNATARAKLEPDFLTGGGPDTVVLLEHYKVLIYCGILDLTIPCSEDASHRRATWKWSKVHEFLNAPRYPWPFVHEPVAYSKSGGGLSEVLFIGAGHMTPADKPAQVYRMLTSFIEDTPLPRHPKYHPLAEDTPDLPMIYAQKDNEYERFYSVVQACLYMEEYWCRFAVVVFVVIFFVVTFTCKCVLQTRWWQMIVKMNRQRRHH